MTDPPPAPSSMAWSLQRVPPPPPTTSMPPPVPGTGLSNRYGSAAAVHHAGDARVTSFIPAVKSLSVAYLLWLFLGLFGAHQFYLGKPGRGISYLLTCAWLTIGWWIDLFTLPTQVKHASSRRRAGV
jgi:hypothetical protein